jgi:hypothetical protein
VIALLQGRQACEAPWSVLCKQEPDTAARKPRSGASSGRGRAPGKLQRKRSRGAFAELNRGTRPWQFRLELRLVPARRRFRRGRLIYCALCRHEASAPKAFPLFLPCLVLLQRRHCNNKLQRLCVLVCFRTRSQNAQHRQRVRQTKEGRHEVARITTTTRETKSVRGEN